MSCHEAVFRRPVGLHQHIRPGGFAATEIGAELMAKAFKVVVGPLADTMLPIPEQEAMAAMFVAAIKYFKNPHSHRHSPIEEQKAAQEMVTFASHLLRIVDQRRPRRDVR